MLHQEQKQVRQKDGEKDSFNDTSRKSSFKDDRKSSLKQLTNSSSISKIEESKKVKLEEEDDKKENELFFKKELNSKMLAKSLSYLDKMPEIVNSSEQQSEKHFNIPIISFSCDNLHGTRLKPEITNILTVKRTLNDKSFDQSTKLDDNNNEKLNELNSSLTNIIISSNLKQLEHNNPDYCYFKI